MRLWETPVPIPNTTVKTQAADGTALRRRGSCLLYTSHVINVADGNDMDQLKAAFDEAKTVNGMPTAIIMKTVKGKGVSFMENQAGWHGKAPNDEQYAQAMEDLEKVGEALCQK